MTPSLTRPTLSARETEILDTARALLSAEGAVAHRRNQLADATLALAEAEECHEQAVAAYRRLVAPRALAAGAETTEAAPASSPAPEPRRRGRPRKAPPPPQVAPTPEVTAVGAVAEQGDAEAAEACPITGLPEHVMSGVVDMFREPTKAAPTRQLNGDQRLTVALLIDAGDPRALRVYREAMDLADDVDVAEPLGAITASFQPSLPEEVARLLVAPGGWIDAPPVRKATLARLIRQHRAEPDVLAAAFRALGAKGAA